jgi:aryl-alcohol dehydrogenase-like predicted oxidoreductase
MAQMAIAWCLVNQHVSTVITGASRPSQVVENFAALDVYKEFTPDTVARIAQAVA